MDGVEEYLATSITPEEWNNARRAAEKKLEHIISIEGDMDGQRREPWYLDLLTEEIIKNSRFSVFTISDTKRKAHDTRVAGISQINTTSIA